MRTFSPGWIETRPGPRAEPAFISLPTSRLRWPKVLPMHRLETSIGGRRRFSSYAGGGGGKERLRGAQPATGPRGARSAPPKPYAPYYANRLGVEPLDALDVTVLLST